ncbi:MAG: crossover junction endodeoxyribonuclease RuvC [Pseudomonadota bacterium]|nr:crossover junction endodeoxyribonuclease RuvC [Pseudomonadota bacterium]
MKLIGLDPGLRATGWGIIEVKGNHLTYIADGTVLVPAQQSLAERLSVLFQGLSSVIEIYCPDEAAVEETFVNKNPKTTLKLGQARGVVLLAPAMADIPVEEYSANIIKKSVVGTGHASKDQIKMMVRTILPDALLDSGDAADALAVAICHAHHRRSRDLWKENTSPVGTTQSVRDEVIGNDS